LGLGARRTVSRFHRAAFTGVVPWALPSAEDLARGADLRLIDDHTVGVIPHGAAGKRVAKNKAIRHREIRFLFAADGRLAERQVVRMPGKKILYRETLAGDGTIEILNKDGKKLAVRKHTLKSAREPSLKADIKDLVVLPLPYRSREHVLETLKIKNKAYPTLRFKDALVLFAADFAAGNASAQEVFVNAFRDRDQRQIGFYVLLAACGQNLDAEHVDIMAEYPDEPLAQYLALHSSPLLRKHASQWAVGSRQWAGAGILKHLAVSHALYQRWQNDKVVKGSLDKRKAERQRALDYVYRNKGTLFGWILLGLMQDRAGKDKELHAALAEAWPLLENIPGLRYAARYEQARCLWKAGQADQARKRFRALYEETFQKGRLPLIDTDFRQALLGNGKGADPWGELLRKTAKQLIDKKYRPAVLALAGQCWQLEDRPLANHLLRTALEGMPKTQHRLLMTLAGIAFYQETGQLAHADRLLQKLLAEPKLAQRAGLWRLAASLAEQRDMSARALEYLEKALEAEYQQPPTVINLETVRKDYDKLLDHYQNLAQAMVTLKIKPPPDFLAKVVRAADRWRALDQDSTQACQQAGRVLQTLGRRDLSWEYLTTPIAMQPNEAAPWQNLAQTLSRKGEMDLADRAYTAAFEAEPTNAQLLWDRAQNLRQAGETVAAQKLFRQLAEGKWQPRFHWLQTQARWQVENR
jgi:Tfp pilus assembly protein PilF